MPTALVTGANSAVGAACVATFADAGWSVYATYHKRTDRIDVLAARLGDRMLGWSRLDVLDADGVSALAAELGERANTLDALVHVASYNEPRLWDIDPLDASVDDLRTSFEVEVIGLHQTLRAMSGLLQAGGAVVGFSSASALHGDSDTFVYNIAKVAVGSYARMVARRHGRRLRINCLAPDSLATDWLDEWPLGEQPDFRVLREGQQRFGRPEEAAAAALFLCSPAASYLNGQTLILDGGAG
jgi:NAD(P)-dependent dehydrogenase (short-subunit alcohol dehydrogenase family)